MSKVFSRGIDRMAAKRDTSDQQMSLYCPNCREDFLSYTITGAADCPRCGRRCGSGAPRPRGLGLMAAGFVVAVIVTAVAYYLLVHKARQEGGEEGAAAGNAVSMVVPAGR
jgi:hypothetical protein